ncbi:hypothetical protein C0995_012180 [Termitomyces sp. Mi166|nr:hypothetical protein C0995_012180 [Termitomyces sp. Mi166\
MSGLALTIDDGSPLITYQPAGAWTQRNSSTDPTIANNFHGKTLMVTQTPGATMSFVFEGVNIVLYGTTSPQHGNYTTDIDGNVGRASGQAASTKYNVPIYISRPLSPTTHTFTILNKDTGILDIDYITWTSAVDPNKNGTLSRTPLDDIDPSFTYYGGTWSTAPLQAESFYDNTGHDNFCLEGDAVSLYGSVGPSNGVYTVQLDDRLSETFVATEPTYVAQTLLYYGSNLGPGNHTLHLVNEENSLLEIDYAEVFTLPFFLSNAISVAGNPSPTETATLASGINGSGQSRSSLSTGAIAGISAGGVIALLLALLVGLYIYLAALKKRWVHEREALTITPSYRSGSSFSARDNVETSAASPFRSAPNNRFSLGSPIETPIVEVRKPIIRSSSPIVHPSSRRSSVSRTASTLVGEDAPNVPITRYRDQVNANPGVDFSSRINSRQSISGRHGVDHMMLGMREKYPRQTNISPLVRESQLAHDFDAGNHATSTESQSDVEFAPTASYSGTPPHRTKTTVTIGPSCSPIKQV